MYEIVSFLKIKFQSILYISRVFRMKSNLKSCQTGLLGGGILDQNPLLTFCTATATFQATFMGENLSTS